MKALYSIMGVFVGLIVIISAVLVMQQPQQQVSTAQPYFQSVAVQHGLKYAVQNSVIGDGFDRSAYEQRIAERQQKRRAEEKYWTLTTLWQQEKDFFAAEEARIKEYCKENGYFYCEDVAYTCDKEDECWKVVITCDNVDFDPSKLRYFDYDKRKDCRQWDAELLRGSKFDYEDLSKQDLSDAGVQLGRRVRESVREQPEQLHPIENTTREEPEPPGLPPGHPE